MSTITTDVTTLQNFASSSTLDILLDLITILFMASVMLPLFLPSGTSIDKLLRAQIAIILFAIGRTELMPTASIGVVGTRNPTPYGMAAAEAALGQRDASFHDLAQLAARHDLSLIGILIDPLLSSERDDPRFAAIVASIGFPLPH